MSRHGLLYVLGAALQGMALLVATPFATRALGADEYGRVAIALALAQTLVSVLAAGFPQLILRDWARDTGSRTDARVTVGLMVIGGASIAVVGSSVVAVLATTGTISDPLPAYAVTLSAGSLTCVAACQAVLRAARRPLAFVILATTSTLGAVLAGIATTKVMPTAGAYLAGYAAVLLVLGAVSVLISQPVWPWRERDRARRNLPPALALVPHGLGMVVLLSSDTILAGGFLGAEGAGTYQPAIMLGNIVFTLASALFNAWGPAVYRQPAKVRWRWMGASAVLIALLLAGAAACLAVTARWVVPVFVGPDFDHDTIATLVGTVAWMGVAYVLYLGCSLVLVEHGRTGTLAAITVTTAVAFLATGAVAVHVFGLEGLALSKVGAHVVLFFATWRVARRFDLVPLGGWPTLVLALVGTAALGATVFGNPTVQTSLLLGALPVIAVAALAQVRHTSRVVATDAGTDPADVTRREP